MSPKEALMAAVMVEEPVARVAAVNAWVTAYIATPTIGVQLPKLVLAHANNPASFKQKLLANALQELVTKLAAEAPAQKTLELQDLGGEKYRLRMRVLRFGAL